MPTEITDPTGTEPKKKAGEGIPTAPSNNSTASIKTEPQNTASQKTEPQNTVSQNTAPERDEQLERLLSLIAPVSVQSAFTKACVYGDLGVGKTVWACTAPGRVLLLAIEAGQKSLLSHIETSDVEVMPLSRKNPVTQIEVMAARAQEGKLPFDTFVLDTFSELQRVVLDEKLARKVQLDDSKSPYTPEGKDYQANNEHMRRIAAAWRDVPANVIFVSHEKEEKDEETGRVYIRPDLAPKVTKTLGGYVDLIGRLQSETSDDGTQYRSVLRVRTNEKVMAKTRIRSLPTLVPNSSFMTIHLANLKQIEQIEKSRKNV